MRFELTKSDVSFFYDVWNAATMNLPKSRAGKAAVVKALNVMAEKILQYGQSGLLAQEIWELANYIDYEGEITEAAELFGKGG